MCGQGEIKWVHGDLACVHKDTLCVHGDILCVHGDILCVHGDLLCVHEDSLCVHEDSLCVHEDLLLASIDTMRGLIMSYAEISSFSARLNIFPVLPMGRLSRNSTFRGYLLAAIWLRHHSMNSSRVSS